MPKLDIKRVVELEGRENFKNNIPEAPSNYSSDSEDISNEDSSLFQ
jgi:hypothetical protein